MKPGSFGYAAPSSLAEAVALPSADPGARPIAGGQSLVPPDPPPPDRYGGADDRRVLATTSVHAGAARRRQSPERLMQVAFTVNGRPAAVDIEARSSLADCLRDVLRLTGTHLGCEHGVCGACTIIVDGAAVRSCLMLAVQAEASEVVTVEGLSPAGGLSPLQQAFRKHHALQCGFCTPGMLTTAHALLSVEPDADEARIRAVLSGNLCRCTGYIPIVAAVLEARNAYRRRPAAVPPAENETGGRS